MVDKVGQILWILRRAVSLLRELNALLASTINMACLLILEGHAHCVDRCLTSRKLASTQLDGPCGLLDIPTDY